MKPLERKAGNRSLEMKGKGEADANKNTMFSGSLLIDRDTDGRIGQNLIENGEHSFIFYKIYELSTEKKLERKMLKVQE